MGCCSAKSALDPESKARRHLSVYDAYDKDVVPDGPSIESAESARFMIAELTKDQVLSMINQHDDDGNTVGRAFSISSETDAKMSNLQPFAPKQTVTNGDEPVKTNDGIGFACRKGLKPDSPNQDSFFILKVVPEYSVFGVFDGHGRKGHDISNFVKEVLPKLLLSDPDLSTDPLSSMEKAFAATQRLLIRATELKQIDASRSGTTCSVIFLDHRTNVLHIAHVGDSRCVLGRESVNETSANNGAALEVVDLTVDHKPDLPDERARIEAAGGKVVFDGGKNYRVYAKNHKGPGLNMSRAMGDLVGYLHAGISASPDVASHTIVRTAPPGGEAKGGDEVVPNGDALAAKKTASLKSHEYQNPGEPADIVLESCSTPDPDGVVVAKDSSLSAKPDCISYEVTGNDRFLLLCSDGVWEFMTSLEAVTCVQGFDRENAMEAAEQLARTAWHRWWGKLKGQVVDDITVVLIFLDRLDQLRAPAAGHDEPAFLRAFSHTISWDAHGAKRPSQRSNNVSSLVSSNSKAESGQPGPSQQAEERRDTEPQVKEIL